MKMIDPQLKIATLALLQTIAEGARSGLITAEEAWEMRRLVLAARDRVQQDPVAAPEEVPHG